MTEFTTTSAEPLSDQLETIRLALNAATNPSKVIQAAMKRRSVLERQIKTYFDQVGVAIKTYNAARRQLLIVWALERQMGYCSVGEHFSALDSLEGVIINGAYVSSGYFESLKSYQKQKTFCPKCRHKIKSSIGRYDGEFTSYATYELKSPEESLDQIEQSDYYLNRLALDNGIVLPSPASQKNRWSDVVIGDIKLVPTKSESV